LGIETGADLREKPLEFLEQHFGKSGSWYYRIARGIDERSVQPDRPRKSVGAEDTFAVDIFDPDAARAELAPLAEKVWRHCDAKQLSGRTVTLKVKFADFQQITRSRTLPRLVQGADEMLEIARTMLADLFPFEKGVRLLGVTLSSLEGLDSAPIADQFALF
jgi:DNA polymerase-4